MGSTNFFLKELEQLTNPAPPAEDDDHDDDVTRAKVVDKSALLSEDDDDDEDADDQQRRTRRIGRILADEDERYGGVVVSRGSMMGEDEDEEMDAEEDDQDDDQEDQDDGQDDLDDGDQDDLESDDQQADDNSSTGLVRLMSRVDVVDERAKGRAVAAQIRLWEQLLGARIRFQRILTLINQLPQSIDQWERSSSSSTIDHDQDEARGLLKSALDDILAVQDQLAKRDDDDDEVISSPDEDDQEDRVRDREKARPKTGRRLDEYAAVLADRRAKLKPFRDRRTIAKWFEKTRLATGRVAGGGGGKSAANFAAFEKDHSQRIEHILADRDRLIKRTRLKRSTYSIIGKSPSNKSSEGGDDDDERKMEVEQERDEDREYDAEIFDDDDFYQQLLRELIERRTAGVTDPVMLSRQWLEMQKLRNKSKKKRVDRKASKGRRCRYDVVAKLVNFMAPVDRCPITDQARDELFGSLFKCTA